MYQRGLGATVPAEQAAEFALRRYTILAKFGTFAKAPGAAVQSLGSPDSRPQQSFGELLVCMHSTVQREHDL